MPLGGHLSTLTQSIGHRSSTGSALRLCLRSLRQHLLQSASWGSWTGLSCAWSSHHLKFQPPRHNRTVIVPRTSQSLLWSIMDAQASSWRVRSKKLQIASRAISQSSWTSQPMARHGGWRLAHAHVLDICHSTNMLPLSCQMSEILPMMHCHFLAAPARCRLLWGLWGRSHREEFINRYNQF